MCMVFCYCSSSKHTMFNYGLIAIIILLAYQFIIVNPSKSKDVMNSIKNQVIDTGLPNF